MSVWYKLPDINFTLFLSIGFKMEKGRAQNIKHMKKTKQVYSMWLRTWRLEYNNLYPHCIRIPMEYLLFLLLLIEYLGGTLQRLLLISLFSCFGSHWKCFFPLPSSSSCALLFCKVDILAAHPRRLRLRKRMYFTSTSVFITVVRWWWC